MGWASGNTVFNPVVRELIDYNVPSYVTMAVCTQLIKSLQGRGWDTEAESLGEFHDHDVIVEAFARCGVFRDDDPRNPDYATLKAEHVEMYPVGCDEGDCRICMRPDERLGRVAYTAYLAKSDGKSLVSGVKLPTWDEQAPEIRAAWCAAALAAREVD